MKPDNVTRIQAAYAPLVAARIRGTELTQEQLRAVVEALRSLDLSDEDLNDLDNFEKTTDAALAELEDEAMIRVLERGRPQSGGQLRRAVEFRRSLDSETDRGCVLMAAAFLDDQLIGALRARFADERVASTLLEGNGPLGSFSPRIDMALSVGLLSREACRDLHLIRKIRNDFAHSAAPMSLEDKAHAARCRELAHIIEPSAGLSSRGRFCRAVLGVLALIEGATLTTKRLSPMPDMSPGRRSVDVAGLHEQVAKEVEGGPPAAPDEKA